MRLPSGRERETSICNISNGLGLSARADPQQPQAPAVAACINRVRVESSIKKKIHNTECTNTCLHTLTLTLLYSTLLAKCPCSLLWVVSNRGPPPRPIAPHALTSTLLTSYSNLPKSPWLHIRCGWLTPVFLGRLRCVALLPSGNK